MEIVAKWLLSFFQNSPTIVQSQSLELVVMVIVINAVIDGFSGEDFSGSCKCLITGVPSQPNVRLQLFRLNRAKYCLFCTNHI